MRILLIEDNDADVLLVREALSEHDVIAELEVVADGDAGFHYWDALSASPGRHCPDLVLLDINLPKRDGWQILRRIRETPTCAHLPVIMLSSSTEPADKERARSLGVEDYFAKPTRLEEFLHLGLLIKTVTLVPAGNAEPLSP